MNRKAIILAREALWRDIDSGAAGSASAAIMEMGFGFVKSLVFGFNIAMEGSRQHGVPALYILARSNPSQTVVSS